MGDMEVEYEGAVKALSHMVNLLTATRVAATKRYV